MGCGCSAANEDVKRYHEMIGSCDSLPSSMSGSNYFGKSIDNIVYSKNVFGGNYGI